MSATTTSFAPAASSSLSTAVPAAPAPESTIRTVAEVLASTTFSALVSAATTTIAVPCWSSWNTGMSSRSRSRRSISKQRGAEMSSRLIPANTGAIAQIVSTIWSTSVVSSAIGNASIPANRLNSTALPSITGRLASGPMLPRPSTAVPSVTTAIVLRLMVRRRASSGWAAMASHTRATPGRVRHRQVVAVAQRHLRLDRELAADVHEERAVADPLDDHAVQTLERLDDVRGVLLAARRARDVDGHLLVARRRDVQGGDDAAGLLDRRGQLADRGRSGLHLQARRDGRGDAGGDHSDIVPRSLG